jgi:hypothetical protein
MMSKLVGDSSSDDGVVGIAHVSGKSGVFGFNKHEGGNGVAGISEAGNGIYARSNTSNGIFGTSSNGSGVHGHSKAQFGVFAVSESDTGIFARGHKFAGYFDGNVGITQQLTVRGFDVLNEMSVLKEEVNSAKKEANSAKSALEQANLKVGVLEKTISELQLRLTAVEQLAHNNS